jgi:low molecular weight phosphotyrosine protein phosphatase
MGEAVLRNVAKERKLDIAVDSAGTAAYHEGENPDSRHAPVKNTPVHANDITAPQDDRGMQKGDCFYCPNRQRRKLLIPTQHDVHISRKARPIDPSDFTEFTHILAADESNLRNLERVKPKNSTADIKLWGSYLNNKPIPDPYYGGDVSMFS